MADRRISDFPVLADAKDDDLILISSESESYSMKVSTFKKAVGYQIAEEANTTAEEAKTTAEEAKTTAEEAKTTAEEGKTTAEEAKTTAEEGKTTAEEAKTTAEEAKTTAEEAKTTAEEAKTTAEEAKTTAEKALAISAIQPDYAENDVASPCHVLNREFYRERIYGGLLTIPEYTGEEVCSNEISTIKFIKVADLKNNHKTIIAQLSTIEMQDGKTHADIDSTRRYYSNYSCVGKGGYHIVVASEAVTHTLDVNGVEFVFNFPEAGLYINWQSANTFVPVSKLCFNDYIKPLDSKFLTFEEIELPEDFEEYTDVIHLSEPLQKDWSKVKIWSADDGLILPESTSPYDFDYSLITETNHAEIGTLPSLLDLSTLPEEAAGASIILTDDSKFFFWMIQLLKTEGTYVIPVTLFSTRMEKASQLEYLRVGDTTPSIDFTATEEGWYVVNLNDNTALPATEEDLSLFSGTYENLKILDWGSLNTDTMKELGVSAPSTEELLELFVKDFVSFEYPPGYYSAKTPIAKTPEKGVDYYTEEDKAELVNSVLEALPKWEGGSY